MGDLSTLEVIIIAIVEGLTEFLPVSSTGHMIITQNLLGIESTEFVKAFNIGLFQCIAMIPGVSRSMATIVGGMAQKMTRKAAAEFSFFLAVPTMFAATVYKMLKLFLDGGTEIIMNNLPALIIGNVVAFVVALLAIKFFISFVTKYGFKAFGWYRIIVGGIILLLLLTGHNLEVV